MKIVSWNINGIRNILTKTKTGEKHKNAIRENSLKVLINEHDPDIVCLQEVRMSDSLQLLRKEFEKEYPFIYVNVAKKAGYSGTAVLSKIQPKNVTYNFEPSEDHNTEGRVIRVDYGDFVLVNVYSPNSKVDLSRLDYRVNEWEYALQKLLKSYEKVILTGDLNVAHTDMDIWTPRGHHKSAGFTDEEKKAFSLHLRNLNLCDTFRKMHPNDKRWTYWSNFNKSRENKRGWRIDYFVVSNSLSERLSESDILDEYYGSDHCPIYIIL